MTWIARALRALAEVIARLLARWQRRRKAWEHTTDETRRARGLERVWAWFVARAASLRVAHPTREVHTPLAEELLAAAQRTRELLFERAVILPAEGRAEPGCGSHADQAATRTDFRNGRKVSSIASIQRSLVASARK